MQEVAAPGGLEFQWSMVDWPWSMIGLSTESVAEGRNAEQLWGLTAPLLQERPPVGLEGEPPGPVQPPLEQEMQEPPMYARLEGHWVQDGVASGLVAPFPQAAHETVNGSHAPQLLLGLDSLMEPPHEVLKLAQERMLYEPAVLKVCEEEIPVEAPAESEETVPALSMAMVVLIALSAIWKILGKLAAGPAPMLETVPENDSLVPVVPEEGEAVVSPAVRSGGQLVLEGAVEEQEPLHCHVPLDCVWPQAFGAEVQEAP